MSFDPSVLCVVFLGGLARALIFFLVASGLTLVFGVLNVINFAHGSFYMLGAFFCYAITRQYADSSYVFWLALFFAPIITAFIGGVVEFFILRRVYKREHIVQLLTTFALILVFQDIVKMSWGGYAEQGTPKPEFLAGHVSILGYGFPAYYIFVILLAIAIGLSLWAILHKTKLGWITRAAASDVEMASTLGINVPILFTFVFMLGAWLAGIGGSIYAPMGHVCLGIDLDMVIMCFIIIIVGGVGSIWGCAIAALIVGLVDAFGALVLPQFTLIFIYVIMAIVLITRPEGLLTKVNR